MITHKWRYLTYSITPFITILNVIINTDIYTFRLDQTTQNLHKELRNDLIYELPSFIVSKTPWGEALWEGEFIITRLPAHSLHRGDTSSREWLKQIFCKRA